MDGGIVASAMAFVIYPLSFFLHSYRFLLFLFFRKFVNAKACRSEPSLRSVVSMAVPFELPFEDAATADAPRQRA